MDIQVQRAMAKWPNVPHCFGWLGLDARGNWRMRDQHAKDKGLLGSKIANVTLRNFINRNYQADEKGQYYFQNGPQRVYVTLQSTPYIVHSDPNLGWVLHTEKVLDQCEEVGMTEEGNLIFRGGCILAQVDDRDLAHALTCIYYKGKRATDQQILAWLDGGCVDPQYKLTFTFKKNAIPLVLLNSTELTKMQHFVTRPLPE